MINTYDYMIQRYKSQNERLYHYTSLEGLELILKNRTIKFNSLPNLDDKEEKNVQDSQCFGKYVFVSSWTDKMDEGIIMWQMYAGKGKKEDGVRISLPTYPFENYRVRFDNLRKHGIIVNRDEMQGQFKLLGIPFIDDSIPCLMQEAEIINSNYIMMGWEQKEIMYKLPPAVTDSKPAPKIKNINGSDVNYNFEELGKKKNKYWNFLSEVRYILKFYPGSWKEVNTDTKKVINNMEQASDLPFDAYYLKIDNEKFQQMGITLSPYISEENRQKVKKLVDEFKLCNKDIESKLLGKV